MRRPLAAAAVLRHRLLSTTSSASAPLRLLSRSPHFVLSPPRRRRGPVAAAASLRLLAPPAPHLRVQRRRAPGPPRRLAGAPFRGRLPPLRLRRRRAAARAPHRLPRLFSACGHWQEEAVLRRWSQFGVWISTSSHVMLAEMIHSIADFANQALLAYGLRSSRRAPDATHPYGYSKERFVWSLISAVGIFCLGSGATIIHGVQNLWNPQAPENIHYAALVIGGSFLIEGASLLVAIKAVKKGAAAEGMSMSDYIWRGHDPTSVAVMTEDGAAVTGLTIAGASLVAVQMTGNAMYDSVGSIIVGNLLGLVAIFLIQRNRHALIGRAIDDHDMQTVLEFLKSDPVVDALYDCKSEVIGPGFFRFKAEIDFNGVVLVQNYLERTGRETWAKQFRKAAMSKDDSYLLRVMAKYGEDVVDALGYEVDRLESEIKRIVPGIRHVDIEAHNPEGLSLTSKGFVLHCVD